MKYLKIIVLLMMASVIANSQSLSVFDVDASNFPTIKAKFFAFDASGEQITNLSSSDFEVTEDGQTRTVTYVSCPAPQPPQALSSVLTIDVSGSMSGSRMGYAKAAGTAWVEGLPLGKSECALTTFNSGNFFNQDFTTDKQKLLNAINGLSAGGGTDFDAGFINPLAGALLAAEKGQHKKVVVFLTDGQAGGNEATIIQKANQLNATVYCVTLDMPCPPILKNIANQTRGQWFENITTKEQAEDVYRKILQTAQGGDTCEIEWESGISCTSGNTQVELTLLQNGTKATTSYQSPNDAVARLEIEPVSIKILEPEVGVQKDTTITVTARNADFNVTNITSSNAAFMINPTSFSLNDGQSRDLTFSYIPADSGWTFTRFEFQTDVCPRKYYASGGRTIKLLHPNGGEVFVAGSDTVITWEGVLPEEPVKLEYRTDDDRPWVTIADSATGLIWPFRVPKVASKKYLARVTAAAKTSSYCDNPDVQLCNQIWMGCNLDVEFYRNGDPIRHAQTNAEWEDAAYNKEGTWCYYDNDPENGAIYGKLYNWYAVNDPRGLAPEGWHIPTDEEWKEMEMCLGMSQADADDGGWRGTDQGSQLAGRADLWYDGTLENNANFGTSGFSSLPGGSRGLNGTFDYVGYRGVWWSSTEGYATYAWYRYLFYGTSGSGRSNNFKELGFSVRCVRD